MNNMDRLNKVRDNERITAVNLMDQIITDFVELHGDRTYGDDRAIRCGIGMLNDLPVTVIMQEKGEDLDEKIKCNFAMSHPEGYRKCLRMIESAQKFNRPIITVIDTAGAYPGVESEKRGQASAIANMLYTLSDVKVPVISLVLSEGGSGGALAIGVADYIYCMENAYYSVISPEGYAEILYKSEKEVKDIIDDLPIFSEDLLKLKIIDEVIKEPADGLQMPLKDTYSYSIREKMYKRIKYLQKQKKSEILDNRYRRFRKYGR